MEVLLALHIQSLHILKSTSTDGTGNSVLNMYRLYYNRKDLMDRTGRWHTPIQHSGGWSKRILNEFKANLTYITGLVSKNKKYMRGCAKLYVNIMSFFSDFCMTGFVSTGTLPKISRGD